jgi:hypothetical protein
MRRGATVNQQDREAIARDSLAAKPPQAVSNIARAIMGANADGQVHVHKLAGKC